MRKFFLTYLFLVFSLCSSAQIELSNWQFREVGTEKFYPAQVPGTVHSDLIRNNLIPNPYYGTKEQQAKFVEEKDWEYITSIGYANEVFTPKHIEMIFEGLDTYAKVFLNGKQILQADNMFLQYKVDVKKHLKKGKNDLKVVFESAVKHGKESAKKTPYILPEGERVFTRKAQYQYGWDWGPRLVTCGIYKNMYFNSWNDFEIVSLHHQIKSINDSLAEVYVISEIESDKDSIVTTRINIFESAPSLDAPYGQSAIFTINLKKGMNKNTFIYQIPNPKQWYCNGQGLPQLYQCDFELNNGVELICRDNFTFALRQIELIKEKDKIGETFYFKVNGKPTFMKGANFIPPDNFMANKGFDYYYKIIQKAKEAGINMLRVWGGGLYLDDEFYTACDLEGILVWQDFMFACGMYPGDEHFLQSVKQEAEQQVTRLRNHPCLALWCGNNENDEGWHNWGWQKQYKYSDKDSSKIWKDYQKVFHRILPDAVKTFDAKTPYVSSSPMFGWGKKESLLRGDSHYWGVWWGMEPFDVYEKKVGRFMSEYGFQGMPSYFTLKKYSDSGDSLSLSSPYIKAHQKHPTGYQTIQTYMERDYKIPNEFFKYVYASQLLQRDGMQIAIEAHRRNKPYCMGTLYWQWNDCWPVTSWSAIDYDQRAKALYYATKKLYANFCISINNVEGQYNVYVVGDSTKNTSATLEIKLKNTKGEVLRTKSKNITIKENSSEIFETFTEKELLKHTWEEMDNYGNTIGLSKELNKNEIYLSCDLILDGKQVAHKNYFFVKPKELKLYDPELKIELASDKKSLLISSKTYVKDLYLYSNDPDVGFEDNFTDIEPGKPQTIKLKSGIKFSEEIKQISLYDINN